MTNPKVSIIIPHIAGPNRDWKLGRLLESIPKNTGYDNYEIIVQIDNPIPDNIGAPKMVKKLTDMSTGELVMFLGNDCIMEKDCLKLAVERMQKEFPEMDGLIGLSDGYWKGEFCTHWLASKKLLPMLGGEFFHTGYNHAGCDNELTERCRMISKYVWAEEAKIFHDHPVVTGYKNNDVDDIYLYAYREDRVAHDKALLEERSKLFGFNIYGPFGAPRIRPQTPDFLTIEPRLPSLPRDLIVLNAGIGSMASSLACQLPFMRFKKITHLEIYQPYINEAKKIIWDGPVDFIKGDLAIFNKFEDYDIVFMFDILEHLAKEDALIVIDRIKKAGAKILLWGPLEKEATKHRDGTDDIPSQEHQSIWTEQEFIDLGFKTEVLHGFHDKDTSAIWATYY